MRKFFTLSFFALIATLAFAQTKTPISLGTITTLQNAVVNRTIGIQKKAGAVSEKVAFVAPVSEKRTKLAPRKVEGDYMELTATEFNAEYYASDGDWYCVLKAMSIPFRFDVITNDPTPLDGTYTYAQMDPDYSWAGQTQSSSTWKYKDATLTVSNGGDNVEAYVTLENDEQFHIVYEKPEVPEITAYKTIEFSAEEASLIDMTDSGFFVITGDNGEQFAQVAFYTVSVEGTYTMDDVYMSLTDLYLTADDYDGVKPFDVKATVTEDDATVIYDAYNGTEYTLIFHFPAKQQGGGEEQDGNVTVTKDANGIITSVVGGESRVYSRSTNAFYAYASSGQVKFAYQSGNVNVVVDGNNYYIQDIICQIGVGSWVKGTVSEDGTKLVIPAGQMIYWSSTGGYGMTVNYGDYNNGGNFNKNNSDITYTIDGNNLILDGAHAYVEGGYINFDDAVLGAFWSDDNTWAGYGEWSSVLTYDPGYEAPSKDLVELPAGADVQGWYMNATEISGVDELPVSSQEVNVAVVGNELYLQGIFTDMPNAWIKGTIEGTTVTFKKLQYLGSYAAYDIYFIAVDSNDAISDATATYDAEKKTITFNIDILANAATDRIYYLQWLQNVVITEAKGTGIQNVNAAAADNSIYTMDGVRVKAANLKGLYIINGKKVVK